MVSGWAETDGKRGFLTEAFNNFFGFPRVTFGGSKDPDGADAELKEPGALASTLDQNTKFGAGAQKWSAKEIASKPCRRTAWQGLVVMWLDTLSRVARFGLLFRSRVTNGMVLFLMQPAGSADCEEWWSLGKIAPRNSQLQGPCHDATSKRVRWRRGPFPHATGRVERYVG